MGILVHTIGDSTLDNLYWMLDSKGSNIEQAKNDCVEGQLQSKLGSDYTVLSHAYDGFTTSSLLEGDTIARVFGIPEGHTGKTTSAKLNTYLENKNTQDSLFVSPLKQLKKSIDANPDKIHYVVLSVGGNDFRERLFTPLKMLQEIPSIHERYLKILDEIKSLGNKNIRPILMLQYPLDVKNDSYGIYRILKVVGWIFSSIQATAIAGVTTSTMLFAANKIGSISAGAFGLLSLAAMYLSSRIIPLDTSIGIAKGQDIGLTALGGLMKTFYKPILARAKQDNIPILDLPNTFNPYEKLYCAQIEPNKEGGRIIAEGISHIVKTHDYSFTSMMYAKKSAEKQFTGTLNPGSSGWNVQYPAKK